MKVELFGSRLWRATMRAKEEEEARAEAAAKLQAADERQQAAIKAEKREQLAEAEATARQLGTMKARAEYAKIKRELGFYDE